MLYPLFKQQCQPYLTAQTKWLVALSGGVDSRVLLHLFSQWQQEYPQLQWQALHVHHGLSANADSWLQQCRDYCVQAGCDFTAEYVQLDVANGDSIEQQARHARYHALAQHVDEHTIVVTGQHVSDQMETVLLALKRGSGPKGLAAMAQYSAFADGMLLRPLLNISREVIVDYANQQQLTWVEDESNQDCRFERNFIRHQISPILRQRWPQIEKTIARSAYLCAQQQELMEQLLQPYYQQAIQLDGSLTIADIGSLTPPIRDALLRLWLDKQGFLMPSAKQLQQIWQDVVLAKQDAAPVFSYGTVQLGRFEQRLYAFPVIADIQSLQLTLTVDQALKLPHGLGYLHWQKRQQNQPLDNSAYHFALPTETQQLEVRFDPTGVVAHPEQRQHSRKLKKLFQEYSVPTWQRQRTPLIFYQQQLVAVANLFVCQPFAGEQYQLIWYQEV